MPSAAAINPVRLELVKNAIGSVVDEMVLTVVRIAYSSIMKDTMDMSSAFCDRHGRLIAQGLSLPLHLGSIPDAMDAVRAEFGNTLQRGDIVITNDPYQGGMHLPDIFMFKPMFVGDHLLGYGVLVAHHNDMGGRVPGSSAADSTEIFQEGLQIPLLKLHSRGVPDQTLLKLIARNVRVPDTVLGDLHAQEAACSIAERGMLELAERYGVEELERCFDALLDYSEREARRIITSIPDGSYSYVDHIDDDGIDPTQPVKIAVTLHVKGDELTADLADSSPQVRGAINSTLSFAKSAVYFAMRSIMDSDAPNNAGFIKPIHVLAPQECIFNPRRPGAVAARGVSGFRLIDAIFGALAQAVPRKPRAAGEGGTTSYSIGGIDAQGRFVLFREALMGAWGGGYRREGVDGVANPAANISNAPIEMVENTAPVRIERYELITDSGGAGTWRGGLAIERQLRFLGQRATFQLRSDRRKHPPFGLHAGRAGAGSNNLIESEDGWRQLPTKFTISLAGGQRFRHTTAGGGGYGDPFERSPEAVLHDVRNGKVSAEAARREYGVQVLDAPWRIDEAVTNVLRRSAHPKK
ncbi:hydantoinase B/oxoprolinase family protein [Bordetella sp. BOR01]|uniref:hydantoinase B/oxoprolinase family protein n=1 Tax=Bordetella sp. BOR01 TaxID=2854779 RepID=UPI001C442ABD|nr:hydantoinase B/oxoprolinase family protein [Bordetella sp. BOR01]MBV7483366.1 hydantoinase B/oxoprolinase family protein [Bordetella sp. BOR01]